MGVDFGYIVDYFVVNLDGFLLSLIYHILGNFKWLLLLMLFKCCVVTFYQESRKLPEHKIHFSKLFCEIITIFSQNAAFG